jgi:hypothetical protein
MFNRKFLLFASLTLVLLIAVGALVWFVGPRLGWGPLALERGPHPDMWGHLPDGRMPHLGMPRAGFGPLAHGWGGMLGLGLIRLLGWLLQIGLIVAIVTWLLRRQAPPMQRTQPISSAPPSEPGAPPQI